MSLLPRSIGDVGSGGRGLGADSRPSEFRKRYKWMALVVLALMGVLMVKLFLLQIVHHAENAAIAHDNIVHRVTLATSRGVIRDRNGVVLAASRESWTVYVVPARLDVDKTWPVLSEMLGIGPVEKATTEQRLREAKADDLAALRKDPKHRLREMIVREDVGRDAIGVLETHADELKAVSWLSVPMRWYPSKELAFHLLGYVNEVSADDLNADTTGELQSGDRVGRTGVERAWERYLRGQRGWRKVILDASGERRGGKDDLALLDEPREQAPVPGHDLTLTIDADLVAEAKRAFAGQLAGGVVVVDVKTGRILALYSKPELDPNDFVEGLTPKQYEGMTANPLHPLIDKTMYEAYFPGSTMKPFSALAGLMSHAVTMETHETCEHIYVLGKTRFKCEGLHGQIALHDAIVHSCNIYFYHLGEKTGLDTLASLANQFGFGQRTGIGINYEVPGLVPTKAWYNQHYGGQFRLGFTLNAAIGQGNTKVTVLQLAMAYAALANGGTLYRPQVVQAMGGGEDAPPTLFPPTPRRTIALDPTALREVLDAMHGVVNDPGGTAYKERSDKVDVAGKTGTAQVSKIGQKSQTGLDPHQVWYFNRDHAWFAGFAPYDEPEIAIVVLVEHGGGGGHNAAPIAMRLFEEWFTKIKPSHVPGAQPTTNGKPLAASQVKPK